MGRKRLRAEVLLLGPCLHAVSGVSTHLAQLFSSQLAHDFALIHFQVGSEGRHESIMAKICRAVVSPLALGVALARRSSCHVHLNTSLERKSYWRDLVYLLIARSMGHRIVYQVHGGALPADFFPLGTLRSALLRYVLRAADRVVLLAKIEQAAYRQFEPRARLVVIPNAIDAGSVTVSPIEQKHDGPLQLVYLGRLAENKGIFTALEAVKLLLDQGRDVRFTVAGAGPDGPKLLRRAGELALGSHFRFAGSVSGDAKAALWRDAHAFVFPTWHREGLPYALLEAMAAGAVPITTRVGAISDVMEDEVHGLFVRPREPGQLSEAIARLDADRAFRDRLAHAARDRLLQEYTIDRLAASFAQLYDDLSDSEHRACAA